MTTANRGQDNVARADAIEANLRANVAASSASSSAAAILKASANRVENIGTGCSAVPAGSYGTSYSAPTITPLVSGKFRISVSIAGFPTSGLTACLLRVFDGTSAVVAGFGIVTNIPFVGVDSGGTTNSSIGCNITFFSTTPYALGVPVTFSVQVNATTQPLNAATAIGNITVEELPN